MVEPTTRRPISVALLALLTVAVGGFAFGGRQAAENASKGDAHDQRESDSPRQGTSGPSPLSPLRDFFKTGTVEAGLVEELKVLRRDRSVRSLIVTVPDPVDSRFGFVFDELMAVVQRALEEHGYVFDRAWLPWELDKKKQQAEKEPIAKALNDVFGPRFQLLLAKNVEEAAYREKFPGVMLFRNQQQDKVKPPQEELFIVYLVGENPTSGIDKQALTASLGLMDASVEKKRKDGLIESSSPYQVQIVGPYFTGSESSLRHVFDAWQIRHPTCSFDVISGAASAVDKSKIIPTGSKFRATVIPTMQIHRAILHYLVRRNASTSADDLTDRPEGVAYLIEANTGFGRAVSEKICTEEICKEVKEDKKDKKDDDKKNEKLRPVLLPFPMHISGVAANYEKARQVQDDHLGLPRIDALIPRLGITGMPNADLLPAQDPATTASVNGKALTNILAVITRKHIRYVGIVASDPRDTIFLAMSIREHCPDVQIFILGSDLLYCLPDFSYYLRGTIVGSTYPLVSANQRWTDPNTKSRQVFPSDGAQGTFNAILAHLQPKKMIEYRPPRFYADEPKEAHQEDKQQADRPPIWITIIGQNGEALPLQFFDRATETETAAKEYLWPFPDKVEPGEVASTELAFRGTAFVTLLAVCAFAALVLSYAFRRPTGQFFWPEPQGPTASLSPWGMAYRFACLASLTLLLLPAAHLCAIYQRRGELADGREYWFPLLFLPFLLLALMGPAFLRPLFPKPAQLEAKTRRRVGVAGALGVVALAAFPFLMPLFWWAVLLAYPLGITLIGLGVVAFRERSRSGAPGVGAGRIACAVIGALAILGCAALVFRALSGEQLTSWEALFFFRALEFPAGVTPLLPLAFLCATFFVWAFFRMKGRWDYSRFRVPFPFPGPTGPALFGYVRQGEAALTGELDRETGALSWLGKRHGMELVLLALLLFAGTMLLWQRFLPTAEGPLASALFFWGMAVASLLVLANLLRFLALWSLLKGLMHEITLLPMAGQFGRLPAKVADLFGGYLFPPRPRSSHARVPAQQLGLLRRETERLLLERACADEVRVTTEELRSVAEKATEYEGDVERRMQKLATPGRPGSGLEEGDAGAEGLRQRVSELTQLLLDVLPRFWPRRTVADAFGTKQPGATPPPEAVGAKANGQSDPKKPLTDRYVHWVELAEGVVATQVVSYVSQFYVQLRTLAWAMIVCAILLLLAATSYPFQPGRLILFTMLALNGCVLAGILLVLVQVNRDELVSRISGTTPNRFTFDMGFVQSVFTFIVPTVSIVALQLSGSFRFLLEPILRVLK